MDLIDNKFQKLISIMAFIFIILVLLIIVQTPLANGYEISIYNVFPWYFWLLLISSISCGIIIMVTESFSKSESKWAIMGFGIILFTNILILLLPFFRDYIVFGRGDVLTHIGFIKDIILSGTIQSPSLLGENYYPAVHTLVTTIHYITGIKIELIVLLLPITFTLFYMISIFILAKLITHDYGKSVFITAFGSILLFKHENLMFAPSILAFFLTPFILFILYKTNTPKRGKIEYGILLIILLLAMPYFHPGEGTLFLIPTLLCIYFSLIIFKKINKRFNKPNTGIYLKFTSNFFALSLILFIGWFFWFISFSLFGSQLRKVTNWLIYSSGTTTATKYSSLLGQANLGFFQLINLVINMYGQMIIYLVFAGVICLVIWKSLLSYKSRINMEEFTFSMLFPTFLILVILGFISYIGVEGPRGLRYAVFAATILIGMGLYRFIDRSSYKKIGIFLTICILIISSSIALFNAFPSPITKSPNFQTTEMELVGMDWFLNNYNESYLAYGIDRDQIIRFSEAIQGNIKGLNVYKHSKDAPDHFNYTNNNTVYGKSFNRDNYFIDWKLSRIFYPEIYPEYQDLWKFTTDDFKNLDNNDHSVNKIYSNGDFWAYYINSKIS